MIRDNIADGERLILIRCRRVMVVLVAAVNTVIVGGCCRVLLAKRRDDRGERLQRQARDQQHKHEFFQRSKHGGAF